MFELSEDYLAYMKSPRWKATSRKALAYYGSKCAACGTREKLHVHHMSYDRFKREPLADLKVLCDPCHKAVHRMHRQDRSVSLRLVTERYCAGKAKK